MSWLLLSIGGRLRLKKHATRDFEILCTRSHGKEHNARMSYAILEMCDAKPKHGSVLFHNALVFIR